MCLTKMSISFIFIYFLKDFIYLLERERERAQAGVLRCIPLIIGDVDDIFIHVGHMYTFFEHRIWNALLLFSQVTCCHVVG